jgi:hypothetical protein
MDQRTHAWIAIRTIALLEDGEKTKDLAKLLKPHAAKAAIGAWIPDLADAKRGGSKTENHIFKTLPYEGSLKKRFVADKEETLKRLGSNRLIADLIKKDTTLNAQWWRTPYKGEIRKPGQHLANRAMAMHTMMLDLLITGEKKIDKLLPGDVRFARKLDPDARTREEQAALYFFMLSHFVADACMPCHCDGRKLAGYSRGLHKEMEKHWARKIGPTFSKKRLLSKANPMTSKKILAEAKKVDDKFGLSFKSKSVPKIKARDVWLEVINLCRASFAVASIIAPPSDYPYDDPDARAPFKEVFGPGQKDKLNAINKAVIHDSVLNAAMIWCHIWKKASKT